MTYSRTLRGAIDTQTWLMADEGGPDGEASLPVVSAGHSVLVYLHATMDIFQKLELVKG